jgi:phosphoribosylanthranilate isomerase
VWVKICANTNLEDALLAAELGADAVGFVFAPSKRQVIAPQVAAITPHLPDGVERVGVFATRNADEIYRTVLDSGLTAVQLHGGFDLELAGRLVVRFGPDVEIIQTIHWSIWNPGDEADSSDQVALQLAAVASGAAGYRVLVDSKIGGASGGTGVAFDWSAARAVLDSQPGVELIVAGGLRPENVAEAVQRLRPWGVDVASGVEASPGRKDPAKLERFIANARQAATLL